MVGFFQVEPDVLEAGASCVTETADDVRTHGRQVSDAAGSGTGAAGDGPLADVLARLSTAVGDVTSDVTAGLDTIGATLTDCAANYTETDEQAITLR